MSTATDVITDALISIGVYSPGQPISDADMQRCFSKLTDMMDSWSNENLTVYCNQQTSIAIIGGQAQYTLGPGGTGNSTRPLGITDDPGSAYILDVNGNVYDIDVVQQNQWNQLGNKVTTTSSYPDTIFYDPQFPLGILNIYPTPNIPSTLWFQARLQFMDLTGPTASIALPPGYKKAIQTGLAVEIWPVFKPDGTNPSPTLLALHASSKGNIKRTNLRTNPASFDAALGGRGRQGYNIYTDAGR